MLNVHGGMAGPCFIAIFDMSVTCTHERAIEAEAGGIIRATFGALFALGIVLNVDPSGVSTAMDIRWHKSVLP